MVLTTLNPKTREALITLRPNNSLSWQGNLCFIVSVAIVTLPIAIGFSFMGAWMVLPFYGLELMLLSASLYYLARRNACQEVIRFSDQQVSIEKGIHHPTQCWVYPRDNTEVHIQHGRLISDRSSITFHSGTACAEVGKFLNKRDKIKLANRLKQIICSDSTKAG